MSQTISKPRRTIKALIAVRGGSLRVENKNIRPFCGSSLLELKVRQLVALPELDGVVVNSEDDEMLDIARKLGAEAVKRDAHFASNTVSMSDVYVNMAQYCDATDIMYANVTNPLVKSETYQAALEQYLNLHEDYDSLASGALVKEFLWLDGRPINYDTSHQPRSQDLPLISKLTFAISILPKELMIQRKNVVGGTPFIYVMDEIESLDIDTPLDFFMAQFLYQKLRIEDKPLKEII